MPLLRCNFEDLFDQPHTFVHVAGLYSNQDLARLFLVCVTRTLPRRTPIVYGPRSRSPRLSPKNHLKACAVTSKPAAPGEQLEDHEQQRDRDRYAERIHARREADGDTGKDV